MFLYYAMQLIHSPWTAPDIYLSRCVGNGTAGSSDFLIDDDTIIREDVENYCGMNVMMDEAIANLTCVIEANGLANNTIMIISGDNGGEGVRHRVV